MQERGRALADGYVPAPLAYKGQCESSIDGGGVFTCGNASCVPGEEVCYTSVDALQTCMPSNGFTDSQCAQATFQFQ